MKIEVTVRLVLECTKNNINEVHYDLQECLDEVMARDEALFGNEECKDEMRLTKWELLKTVEA